MLTVGLKVPVPEEAHVYPDTADLKLIHRNKATVEELTKIFTAWQ
jgi:hypothetical protein